MLFHQWWFWTIYIVGIFITYIILLATDEGNDWFGNRDGQPMGQMFIIIWPAMLPIWVLIGIFFLIKIVSEYLANKIKRIINRYKG